MQPNSLRVETETTKQAWEFISEGNYALGKYQIYVTNLNIKDTL
jgi:hypothetical protein